MKNRLLTGVLLALFVPGTAMAELFLVTTSEGPGFTAPSEVVDVLERGILPTFDRLQALQAEKKIIAGGLPVGSRTFYLVIEAGSHAEIDRMLRDLPAWGVFSWTVTPLQTLAGRADMERKILAALKSGE